jgi:ABC-2 type transport system ATP-binding protein
MSDEVAIKVDGVSKTFKLPHEKTNSLKGALINFRRRNRAYEVQQVLKNVSFEIQDGEFFGIVGRNGSGKSTLLKMLAGIYMPSEGSVKVNGKLTPFIELGVGFSPELTGRENVFLNGSLLGFSRKEMEVMYKDIVAFAELERFMDQKLKNYSSGMQVRLAFSIAIRAQSDILVLDEVLAVGDAAFQRKCYDYFMSLKKDKRTVVLVTHDMGAVRQYCDRAVMIENGEIIESGSPDRVAQAYQKLFSDDTDKQPTHSKQDMSNRWGDGRIRAEKPKVTVTGKKINIRTSFVAKDNTDAPIYGFTVFSPNGTNVLEYNTRRAGRKTELLKKGDVVTIDWEIPNIFASGTYSISVASCDQSATRFYDWVNDAASFDIQKDDMTAGTVDPPTSITHYEVTGV